MLAALSREELNIAVLRIAVVCDLTPSNRFQYLLNSSLECPLRFEIHDVVNLRKADAVVATIGILLVDKQFSSRHMFVHDFADLTNRVVLGIAADVENLVAD